MKGSLRTFFQLLRKTFQDWNADHAPRLAAALAYYTAFSLAPLLVIVIAIAGALLGTDNAREQVVGLVARAVSGDAAELVSGMIESAAQPKEGTIATILGLITLVFGAIGAFGQLQSALDAIWDVEDRVKPGGVLGLVRTNLLNFGMVVFLGFLLLVSLVVSTMLAGMEQFIGRYMEAGPVLQAINIVISFGVVTLLFALVYKVLPHTEVAWRDVWIGAAFTAVLFSIGRIVLSLYLVNSGTTSTYGVAGSFVVILLWIYYSAQILLFGAEFTQVFSEYLGTRSQKAGAATSSSLAIVPASSVPAVRAQPARAVLAAAEAPKPRSRALMAALVFAGMVGMALLASRRPEQPRAVIPGAPYPVDRI